MKKKFLLAMLLLGIPVFGMQAITLPDGDNEKNNKNKEAAHVMGKETWEFYSSVAEPDAEEIASAKKHKFGKEVSFLYDKFLNAYVVKEEIVPGDPSRRTVIRKPGIYNAVRSIEKQLGKDVKSDKMIREKAVKQFTNVLKIALAAIDSDTETFEIALQDNRKDPSQLLTIFDRVNLKSLY